VPGGIGARAVLALAGRLGQHAGVGHQRVDVVDAVVEVVLDGVKVAVILLGDLGRDGAVADLVHVVGGHDQRADHRVEHRVDALDELALGAIEEFGLAPGSQVALAGVLHQPEDLIDDPAVELFRLRRIRRFQYGRSGRAA
jgi:hypothetical protein